MKKYEYKIEVLPYKARDELAKHLNKLGQEGWHCYQVNYSVYDVVLHYARVVPE